MFSFPKRGLSWGGLEALYQVVQAGGFRKAEELYGLSASALHQRVTRLEDALDFAVLDRTNPRDIKPTAGGEILFRFTAPFFEGLGEMIDRAAARASRILRIASTQALLQTQLVEPLARYQAEVPEVEIRIEERPWLEIVDLVTRGKVDLGFAPAPPPGHDLEYDDIYESEYYLICPKGHPLMRKRKLDLARIAAEPLILFHTESATGQLTWSRFESANVPIRPYCIANNVGTIQHFVSAGLGVAIVSGMSIPPKDRRPFDARKIGSVFGNISQGVMWRRHWIFRRAVRSFMELLPQGEVLQRKLATTR